MSRSFFAYLSQKFRVFGFFLSLVGVWHPPWGDISRGFEFLFLLSFKSVKSCGVGGLNILLGLALLLFLMFVSAHRP